MIKSELIKKINSLPVLKNEQSPSKEYIKKNISTMPRYDRFIHQNLKQTEYEPKTKDKVSTYTKGFSKQLMSKTEIRGRLSSLKRTEKNNYYLQQIQNDNKKLKDRLKNIQKHNKESVDKNLQQILDKPKISDKRTDYTIGYAVNSHTGSQKMFNQDRICITSHHDKIHKNHKTSFFGIYAGRHGIMKAEYFRDHFHSVLAKDFDYIKNPRKALQRTFQTLQANYRNIDAAKRDYSLVDIIVLLITEKQMFLLQSGNCRSLISTDFGKSSINPIQVEGKPALPTKRLDLREIRKQDKYYELKQKLEVVELNSPNNIDFIILGSQGLYEGIQDQQLTKTIWKSLLSPSINPLLALSKQIQSKKQTQQLFYNQRISIKMGQIVNKIITNSVLNQKCINNVSMIMIGCQNLQLCFNSQVQQLILPYTKAE